MIISFNRVGGVMLMDFFLPLSVFQSLLWTVVAIQACDTGLAYAIYLGEEPYSCGS